MRLLLLELLLEIVMEPVTLIVYPVLAEVNVLLVKLVEVPLLLPMQVEMFCVLTVPFKLTTVMNVMLVLILVLPINVKMDFMDLNASLVLITVLNVLLPLYVLNVKQPLLPDYLVLKEKNVNVLLKKLIYLKDIIKTEPTYNVPPVENNVKHVQLKMFVLEHVLMLLEIQFLIVYVKTLFSETSQLKHVLHVYSLVKIVLDPMTTVPNVKE